MLYELIAILPAQVSETEVDGVLALLSTLVDQAGGKVEKSQQLGKIKLAYPIKRQRHGVYVLLYVEIAPDRMSKLDQNLRLADEVVRHMLIARPEGIPAAAFKLVAYTPPLTPEGRRTQEREDRPAKSSDKSAEPSATSEEIAGKLDAILESDIMKNV